MQDALLFRIVYYSLSLLPLGSTGDHELQKILEVSRARNRSSGITGALRYDGVHFLQVLEGPRGPVVATMTRIQRDPRHSKIHILEAAPVSRRDFAAWTMADIPESIVAKAKLINPHLVDIHPATGAQAAHSLRELLALHRG